MRAAASSIASGSPSRRRQISATAAALASVSAKLGRDRPRSFDEERHRGSRGDRRGRRRAARIGQRQRRHRELVLDADAQRGAAGGEHGQVRAGRHERGHVRRRRGDLLDVVQDQQQRRGANGAGQHRERVDARRPRARRAPGRSPAGRGPGRGAGRDRRTPRASAKLGARSAATWSASRVLPTPPGPVSVSSGTSSRSTSSPIAATSRSRPTSGVRGSVSVWRGSGTIVTIVGFTPAAHAPPNRSSWTISASGFRACGGWERAPSAPTSS